MFERGRRDSIRQMSAVFRDTVLMLAGLLILGCMSPTQVLSADPNSTHVDSKSNKIKVFVRAVRKLERDSIVPDLGIVLGVALQRYDFLEVFDSKTILAAEKHKNLSQSDTRSSLGIKYEVVLRASLHNGSYIINAEILDNLEKKSYQMGSVNTGTVGLFGSIAEISDRIAVKLEQQVPPALNAGNPNLVFSCMQHSPEIHKSSRAKQTVELFVGYFGNILRRKQRLNFGETAPSCDAITEYLQKGGHRVNAVFSAKSRLRDDKILIDAVLHMADNIILPMPLASIQTNTRATDTLTIEQANLFGRFIDRLVSNAGIWKTEGIIDIAKSGDNYFDRAVQIFDSDQPGRDPNIVINLLDLAISRSPKSNRSSQADAHFYKGLALLELGEIERAINALKASIEFNPKNYSSYFALAELYQNEGEHRLADKYFGLAVTNAGNESEIYRAELAIGTLKMSVEDLNPAIEYFKYLNEKYPEKEGPSFYSGEIYRSLGQYPNARKSYLAALKKNSGSERAKFGLADVYISLGNIAANRGKPEDWSEAVSNFDKAINTYRLPTAYYRRAFVRSDLIWESHRRPRDLKPAIDDYRAVIDLLEKQNLFMIRQFPWLLPNLAELYVLNGQPDEAKTLVDRFWSELEPERLALRSPSGTDLRLVLSYIRALSKILASPTEESSKYDVEYLQSHNFKDRKDKLDWSFEWLDEYFFKESNSVKRKAYAVFSAQIVDRSVCE